MLSLDLQTVNPSQTFVENNNISYQWNSDPLDKNYALIQSLLWQLK